MPNTDELMIKIRSLLTGNGFQEATNKINRMQRTNQGATNSFKTQGQVINNNFVQLSRFGVNATAAATQLKQMKVDPSINTNLQAAKLKLSSMGVDITSLKGKLLTIKEAIKEGADTPWQKVKNTVSTVGEVISSKIGSALEGAKSKLTNLQNSLGELGMAMSSVFGALGLGSITQATIGLSLARDSMKNLMNVTMGNATESQKLISIMDNMTNNLPADLDSVANAMSRIKMSTSVTNEQLMRIAPLVGEIGARSVMMGKDSAQAATIMDSALDGLNRNFLQLRTTFGITKEKLMDLGWSGAATDVEGYVVAMEKYLNKSEKMSDLMESNTGKIANLGKQFRTAGREIGDIFLPGISDVLTWLLKLNEANPIVFKLVIATGALISAFTLILPVLVPVIGAFQSLLVFLGLVKGANEAYTISILKNTIAEKAAVVWTTILATKERAIAIAMGISTAVRDGNTTSTIKNTIATKINTMAQSSNRVVALLGAAALTLYTAAQNRVLLSTIKNAIATKAAAVQWLYNAAMSANPILLVIVAITALITLLWHLYNTNEDVRNSINWLWIELEKIGQGIYSYIKPSIDWLVQGFQQLYNSLIGPITSALEGAGDIFVGFGRIIISVWDYLTNNPIGQVISGLLTIGNPLLFVITHFEWLKTTVMNVWKFISDAVSNNPLLNLLSWLNPVTILLFHLNDLKLIFEALSQAWNEFANSADGQELFASLGEVWSQLQAAFNELGPAFNEIIAAFQELWAVFFPPDSGGPESVSSTVSSVGEAAKQANPFIQSAVDVVRAFGWVLQNVVISMVVGARVYIEALALVFERVAAGVRLVTDVISFLTSTFNALISGQMSIPQALATIWGGVVSFFASIFSSIIVKVVSFGSTVVSKFNSIFSSAVNTVKSFMSKLPGIVWTEMMNVANKIGGAASYIFQQVQNTFGNIVYWAKKVLCIASPGFIANAISGEMNHVTSFIHDNASNAYNAAKRLGNSIIDGFGNPVLPRIENEGIAPYDYDYKPGEHKWPFGNWPNGDYHVPSSSAVVVKNEDTKKDLDVNVTVKNHQTFHINGGDSEQIAQQVEQSLTAALPANILEALIKGLNKHNVSNGNI